MRLINAYTLELEEFPDERGTKYAILSHRWEDGEVSFQDMQDLEKAKTKNGFTKILKSCECAREDGLSYVWVDTCCINKESSAELSEAINSMYRWYGCSEVCYTFLSDVQIDASDSEFEAEQQLKQSKWFTRGWTLQELLAPKNVQFFDHQWDFLGTKNDLGELLSDCTGIRESIIRGTEPPHARSIAERMSWASQRVTTRIEDIAYCLVGLFAVNMPLLYGEGEKAFLRLQEEIIKQTDDHSIFAWHMPSDLVYSGLLSGSPAAFAGCGSVKRILPPRVVRSQLRLLSSEAKPHTMTNRGLSIQFMALQHTTDTYLVRLNCKIKSFWLKDTCLAIFMRRLDEDDQYVRISLGGQSFKRIDTPSWDSQALESLHLPTTPVGLIKMHIRQNPELSFHDHRERVEGIRIVERSFSRTSEHSKNLRFSPKILAGSWNPAENRIYIEQGQFAVLDLGFAEQGDRQFQLIMLGFDLDWNPICYIQTGRGKLGPRRPPDTLLASWSEVVNGFAKEINDGSCLDAWNLRGDRIEGIDVLLESQLDPRRGLHSGWGDVRVRKEWVENKLGWVAIFTTRGTALSNGRRLMN